MKRTNLPQLCSPSTILLSQRLSEVLVHQATLLDHIMTDQRYYSEYFRVAFYGNFPVAIRDKQFIVSPHFSKITSDC